MDYAPNTTNRAATYLFMRSVPPCFVGPYDRISVSTNAVTKRTAILLLKAISVIPSSPLFSDALALDGSLRTWADGDTLRDGVSRRHEHRSRVGQEEVPNQLGNPSDDSGTLPF